MNEVRIPNIEIRNNFQNANGMKHSIGFVIWEFIRHSTFVIHHLQAASSASSSELIHTHLHIMMRQFVS
jgi:hypothetical protein